MMKPTDRILGPVRGTEGQALAYATDNGAARPGEVTAYVREGYRLGPLVGIDPSIVVAQSVHETTEDRRPWGSYWWLKRLNPAGIGITGDPAEDAVSHIWPNGTASAQSQLAHLLVYALGPADAGSLWFQKTGQMIRAVDPRYDAYLDKYGNTAQAQTIADLGGTWATDTDYGSKVAARGNAIYPHLPDQEGPDVTEYRTTIPGLPGGPLVTDYPIKIKLVPEWRTNNRPGIKAKSPRRSVQHGNGNPNSTAAGEAMYLYNGAEGRQASYHGAADDIELYIMVPLDEVTWQAADNAGPGNMNGYSCEMVEDSDIWANPTRRAKCIHINADFMGRVAARLKAAIPEQHWDFNYNNPPSQRHDCPNKLRHVTMPDGRKAWDHYEDQWYAAKADELARMSGGTTTTTTTPAPVVYPPMPIPAPDKISAQGYPLTVNNPTRFLCIQGGRLKTAPSDDAPNVGKPAYKANRRYTFKYRTVVAGEDWLVSENGSWAPAKNFTQ